jgi:UDP-N-acetylglucosamine acyltransferase
MEQIHSTAIIDPAAELAEDVIVGPHAIIGPNVKINAGSIIEANAFIDGHTEIGENCRIAVGAIVGTPPQDTNYKGEPTRVIIGNNTTIREYVTINRASGEGSSTEIGENCMLMAYTHIAHNCKIGNHVNIANYAGFAGHISVGDYAFIGGLTAFHQYIRIGKMAIVSGFSGTRQDIPPYAIADGRPAIVRGVNKIGLRRCGFSRAEIDKMRYAFKVLWFDKLNLSQALEKLESDVDINEHIQHLIEFIRESRRGVIMKRESEEFDSL